MSVWHTPVAISRTRTSSWRGSSSSNFSKLKGEPNLAWATAASILIICSPANGELTSDSFWTDQARTLRACKTRTILIIDDYSISDNVHKRSARLQQDLSCNAMISGQCVRVQVNRPYWSEIRAEHGYGSIFRARLRE